MENSELEKSENVTIIAETFSSKPATVSSLKSENSTEHLICKTPQKNVKKVVEGKLESGSLVVSAGSVDGGGSKVVLFLGLSQVVLGSVLVGAGAVAVVRGAALSRVGAGLWAGGVAVLAGVVGAIAGINDCYKLQDSFQGRNPMLTAFLALSLACLACGNSAAVLAATGLHRDYTRGQPLPDLVPHLFQDEMEAWAPVLTNIVVLIIAAAHCLVSILTIYHLSKRICPCFRPKVQYDHNQFDPNYKTLSNYVININESQKNTTKIVEKSEKCKLNEKTKKEAEKKKVVGEFGSANSKEKLVNSWLGRHQAVLQDRAPGKVRKVPRSHPVMLVPAHPASTLGRVPVMPPALLLPPRYATLPPAHYHAPPAPHVYYSAIPDARIRRRRSPRDPRSRRRREGTSKDSQLTRSLERIHRKRRAERRAERERACDNQLKQTYTGLDRAYAEQYLAACDSSRSHLAEQYLAACDSSRSHLAERGDSLSSTASSGHHDSF